MFNMNQKNLSKIYAALLGKAKFIKFKYEQFYNYCYSISKPKLLQLDNKTSPKPAPAAA